MTVAKVTQPKRKSPMSDANKTEPGNDSEETGVVTSDKKVHEVQVIVYATEVDAIIDLDKTCVNSIGLAYWRIGEHISNIMQTKEGSSYGDGVMQKIAEDIASRTVDAPLQLKVGSLHHALNLYHGLSEEMVNKLTSKGVGLRNLLPLCTLAAGSNPGVKDAIIDGVLKGGIPQTQIRSELSDRLTTKKGVTTPGKSSGYTSAIKSLKAISKYADLFYEKLGTLSDTLDIAASDADADDDEISGIVGGIYEAAGVVLAQWAMQDTAIHSNYAKFAPAKKG